MVLALMGNVIYLADWLEQIDGLLSDPFDAFEDELSRRLGLTRPPAISADAWHRQRVSFINSHPDADRVASGLMQPEPGR